MASSQVRQNYHSESEEGINLLIKLELDAMYAYVAMASYFDRLDVALPGLAKYFRKAGNEEWGHANIFIDYQNKRGGQVKLSEIQKPDKDSWDSGLEAMESALQLEKEGYDYLLKLHAIADKHQDFDLANFVEEKFLSESVSTIKEIGEYVTQFAHVGPGHGEYHLDRDLK